MLTTPFQQQKEKQLWMLKLYKHHHHFCKKKNATQEIITNQNVSYRNRTHKNYHQSVYSKKLIYQTLKDASG